MRELGLPHDGRTVWSAPALAPPWSSTLALPLPGLTPDAMCLAADRQLYQVKTDGRDRVRFVAVHDAAAPTPLAA